MSYRKFRPLHQDVFEDISKLVDGFLGKDMKDLHKYSRGFGFRPAANIRETDEAFFLELIVPGRKKSDFNLKVTDDQLTISYDAKKDSENKIKGKYTRKEFSFASFKRSFTLTDQVDTETIHAKYEDGILRVTFPKKVGVEKDSEKIIEVA